jgi:hypothetical protein
VTYVNKSSSLAPAIIRLLDVSLKGCSFASTTESQSFSFFYMILTDSTQINSHGLTNIFLSKSICVSSFLQQLVQALIFSYKTFLQEGPLSYLISSSETTAVSLIGSKLMCLAVLNLLTLLINLVSWFCLYYRC